MIMASNIDDDRDESFISKFTDFIEENDADSAGISPYVSVSEAHLCTYYTGGLLKPVWETQKKILCHSFT